MFVKYSFGIVGGDVLLVAALSRLHNKKVQVGKLLSRKDLQSPSSDRQTILVQFKSETPVPYNPGDHVAVFAQNDMAAVASLLKRLNIDTRAAQSPVQLEVSSSDADSDHENHQQEEVNNIYFLYFSLRFFIIIF